MEAGAPLTFRSMLWSGGQLERVGGGNKREAGINRGSLFITFFRYVSVLISNLAKIHENP